MKILIKTSKGEVPADLTINNSTKKILEVFPIKGKANTWGEEIYFEIPLNLGLEQGFIKHEMEIGDLAYWPPGKAFCIFFGKTPASTGEKPKAASEVTFLGKIQNIRDIEIFKNVEDGEEIIIEKVE